RVYQFHHLGSINNVAVVDGAHYTERIFGCKPPLSKKPGKCHQWSCKVLSEGRKGLLNAC
ncbi:hypothetical protein, partial [Pseudomonas veronii]|uniref:hypothetical protein n=1 Tax=Pseudomonas veronii TaxID=76761 RepID=UPI001CC1FB7A